MKIIKHLIAVTFLIVIASACKKDPPITPVTPTPPTPPVPEIIAPPTPFGFYVVGYFPSYRDVNLVPDVKFRMCNVVNYAFANIDATGNLSVAVPANLTAVKIKAKANAAKIFISLSGPAANFKTMASNAISRTSFINQTMNIVRTYGLDGVDVDWEFPRSDDGTDLMYTTLMKQLSDSCHLGRRYYLTAAITAGKYAGAVRDGIQNEILLGTFVDWFNIMSYDDFSTTVAYKHHCDLALFNTSINYWNTTRGLPASKTVIGIAGYGRPSGITQTGTTLSFSQIIAQAGNPLSDSAVVTTAGYATPYTIYYNGIATVKKKAIKAKQVANGIMLWEKSQDAHDNNSLLKAVCDTVGRAY
ncbi:MAG: glycosyl hydrolase family 18 protein [Ferruginibacter sp.]|nr:hypothetical protein [Ferruginibacter sp.]